MSRSPHPAIVYLWAGTMLSLSVFVGAFAAPATTSPALFVVMVAAGALGNLLATALVTALPLYVRKRRGKSTSLITKMVLFTMAWLAATVAHLLVAHTISQRIP